MDGTPVNQPGRRGRLLELHRRRHRQDRNRPRRLQRALRLGRHGRRDPDFHASRHHAHAANSILEGDGGTFGTGHGSGQLSGLLGLFDYSVGAGYFSTATAQRPGGLLPRHDAFRKFRLEVFGYRYAAADPSQQCQRRGPARPNAAARAVRRRSGPAQRSARFLGEPDLEFRHWRALAESAVRLRIALSGLRNLAVFRATFIDKYNRAGSMSSPPIVFSNGGITAGYEYRSRERAVREARHNQAGYVEVRSSVQPAAHRRRRRARRSERILRDARWCRAWAPPTRCDTATDSGAPRACAPPTGRESRSRSMFPAGLQAASEAGTEHHGRRGHRSVSCRRTACISPPLIFTTTFTISSALLSVASHPNCPAFGGSYFNTDKARAYGANSSFEVKAATLARVSSANYSYDDSKVLVSPNASDPALAAGQPAVQAAAEFGEPDRQRAFPRMNWNIAGILRGPRAPTAIFWAWALPAIRVTCAGTVADSIDAGPRPFDRGAFRESVRPALSGCRRLSGAGLQLPRRANVRLGRAEVIKPATVRAAR